MNYTEMEAKVREATNNEPWVCLPSQCGILHDLEMRLPLRASRWNMLSTPRELSR